ncbi:hypothetical protein [Cryobacterium soli]|nr:hypothetical protein [Cryobacterium soli]
MESDGLAPGEEMLLRFGSFARVDHQFSKVTFDANSTDSTAARYTSG